MNLQKQIRKVLVEYWVKPKQDNTDIEKVINDIMSKKYPWWKKITIEEFSYSQIPPHSMTLYGSLEVDKEWAKKYWKKNNYGRFLGQDQIRFEDLLVGMKNTTESNNFYSEIRNFIKWIILSETNYTDIGYIRMGILKIKFV